MLCSKAMLEGPRPAAALSKEAEAILWSAQQRGVLELKGGYTAYSGAARLLAVCIEQQDESTLEFRSTTNVEITTRYIEGFRQLCQHGLILHHLFRDFSLSQYGFERAKTVDPAAAKRMLDRLI